MTDNETQYTFLVDRNGRGWRLERLERPQKFCFQTSCKAKPVFEMTRQSGWMVRREQLCLKCYNERVDAWDLRRIDISNEE